MASRNQQTPTDPVTSTPECPRERQEVTVRGIVQGVGFRPFIYSLARLHGVSGLVRNDAEGVYIEAQSTPSGLETFLRGIREDAPPLALVESITTREIALRSEDGFRIEASRPGTLRTALISPDVATCDDCIRELLDPADRRYRYPFINCTNCGPRFTITYSVPYDRCSTTMAGFTMCPVCRAEYDDPENRRFHAQPNACPVCGPSVRLVMGRSAVGGHRDLAEQVSDAIAASAAQIKEGAIVAIKGLGGYHLACDPFNPKAVRALRSRKVRQDKPFALMAANVEQARSLCVIDEDEAGLLVTPAHPIVLLERRENVPLAEDVAPRQSRLGVMLAYAPVHHLLLDDVSIPLVMTSGNRRDEPISFRDEEALEQLGGIADYMLVHDRPIHMRCDDSVTRIDQHQISFIRRSRGYAPAPLRVVRAFSRQTLACGGELKNTFCVAKNQHAILSHHIGDLENYETLRSFREGIEHFCRAFDIRPQIVVHDLHPEYLSTKYARELEDEGMPTVGVQHHHAHIASCLADNERPVDEQVIGVALDGTGFGSDGAIWGGEFLAGSISTGFVRRGHLAYIHLPGGVAAIRQPWRMAVAHLFALYGEGACAALPLPVMREAGERNIRLIERVIQSGPNTPMTSSAGRLFDAVAALIGVPGSMHTTYEGQAAVELELVAGGRARGGYSFDLRAEGDIWVVETGNVIEAIVRDVLAGMPAADISARFHRTMAEIILAGCRRIQETSGISVVALSGGTFQNALLLRQGTELLESAGFIVYRHRRVPANDGGLSLGQAVLADSVIRGTHEDKRSVTCA